jgi:hypothetical protein
MSYLLGILFFTVGNILAWFQFNSQFVWSYWQNRPILSNVIFAIPMGMCFWYAVKHIVAASGELWTSKLVGFGVSNFVFAILTYALLKESIFTPKTMICLFLASLVIVIQVFWK